MIPLPHKHKHEHCTNVVDGSWTPQELMREHVQHLEPVLSFLLLLLQVLQLCLLLEHELKLKELLSFVQ